MAMTLTVVGLGLIGGSFALATRRAGLVSRVIGVSSAGAVEAAQRNAIIHDALPLESAVAQADIVFLSSTIRSIIDVLPRLNGQVKPGALVTDAGSTKRHILSASRGMDYRFIGGHPMAGKEKGGVEQADAALFEGRPWVLTPDPSDDDDKLARLEETIRAIGANPVRMSAHEHDAVVARTSHLPQLLSTALAASLEQGFHHAAPVVAGPGLLDATRLALSPWPVWRDILETNRDEITKAMADFLDEWKEQYARLADDADLGDQFARAADFAQRLRNPRSTF